MIEERKGKRWRRSGERSYGCWERFKDSSHTSCQVLGWGMQSMTSLLCGGVELLSNLTASAPPLLWFCLGWIKKAQMEHRTWRWASSPKMSGRQPSACGRLVRSTLVKAEHRPIHPANKAYSGLCYDWVTTEKPLFLTQTLSLCNPFGLSCHAALTGAEAGARTRNTANWPWRWNYCSKPALMWEQGEGPFGDKGTVPWSADRIHPARQK